MLIDEKLNWEHHIANVTLRIRSRLVLLRKGKNLLTKHAKKILYYAQLHSIFQYGIVIWGPLIQNSKLKKIQKLQNKCVQLIDPRNRIDQIYNELNIPKISEMINLECCKLWQRHSLGLLPSKLETLMTKDNRQCSLKKTHQYGTRNKKVLNTPFALNALYKKSFFVTGLTQYQKLDSSLREIRDISLFTKTLKNKLTQ